MRGRLLLCQCNSLTRAPKVILTIRTYALYDKSKRILALILGFQLGLFGVSVVRHFRLSLSPPLTGLTLVSCVQWAVATQPSINGELVAATGCMWDTPMSSSWRIAIAWEALFAIDCLLFTLTTMRTVRDARGLWGARTRDGRPNIFGVVLRDGAMYFACVTTLLFRLQRIAAQES